MWVSGSHSMDPGAVASVSPRKLLEMQILGPTPTDLLHQKLWGLAPRIGLRKLPGD